MNGAVCAHFPEPANEDVPMLYEKGLPLSHTRDSIREAVPLLWQAIPHPSLNIPKGHVMIKYAKPLSALAILLAAGSASAQGAYVPGFYGELGYTSLNIKGNTAFGTAEFKPAMLRGIVGYSVHNNLAIEGMLGFGIKDSGVTLNGGGTGIDGKVNHSVGIFLKPRVKINEQFEVFGRVGYLHSKISGGGGSADEGDFAYGVGMNYSINRAWSVNVDYMRYYDKNPVKASGITFGVGYKF